MRLNRLDLTRYGHFTDRVLDFGDAVPGQPDLHILHGPNEAGKSTLLSAWLDLLFGIPARSDHAFLHDYKSMQIGAELALADGRHALVRTKGNKDTLTEGGAPVPQAVLAAALGGLDRAACAEMFALDAATMEQGGDLILSSQGRLGELLFAATAGLSELSRRLDALDAKGADFWKKGATKGRLKLMLADLARMDAERAALDVQAPDYARRRAAKAEAQAERDRLQALESAARARHDRAKARLDALPVLAEWGELTAELAPLEGLPDAPEDWADRVARLIRTDIDLTATARGTAQRLSDLTAGLVALTPDEAALALSDDPAFDDDLRARYRTARSDLPRRRDELAAALDRLAELSAACGVEPDAPAPDAATLDALDRLAADHGTLAERLRSARAEAGQAMAALDDAGGPLDDAADPDTAALRAALEPLRSADLMARTRLAAGEAAEAEARRDAALAWLAPWQGDAAALRALPVPSADTLARWRAELDAARAARADATARAADRAAHVLKVYRHNLGIMH